MRGRLAVVEYLLLHGAEFIIQDLNGNTLLVDEEDFETAMDVLNG